MEEKTPTNVIESLIAEKNEDRATYKREVARLQQELDAARAKVPADSLILKAEEARQWEEYKALGLVTELKDLKAQKAELEGELGQVKQSSHLGNIASDMGFTARVFTDLNKLNALQYESVSEETDGAKPTWYVKTPEGHRLQLGEYAKTYWKDFMPSLQINNTKPNVSYIPQSAGGQSMGTDDQSDQVDAYLQAKYYTKN